MTVALDPELPANRLSHLIVADIAPSRGALSSEFQGYVQAMQKIEEAGVKTRQEADRVLKPYEQVRLFRVRPCTEPTEVTHCLLGCHDARISVDEPRASLCAPPSSSQVSYTARYPGEINTRDWWLSLGTRRTVFRETNAVHQGIKEQVSTELMHVFSRRWFPHVCTVSGTLTDIILTLQKRSSRTWCLKNSTLVTGVSWQILSPPNG